ncbi:hypothetical protein [Paenarthrobacter histidinolovorans]|uniref:Uncharacterized protein n=1 Tax=Paenarthrobacter histidinolovorans TaxID=43664 RepID=A0ABW8MZF7_9MICC
MTIQRKSQIPKAAERSLVDAIVGGAGPGAPTVSQEQSHQDPPQSDRAEVLQPPARRQRKPVRVVYTSKIDPELKKWASSFKPDEDFLEVVEQGLWILRLARSGRIAEAVTALEEASKT